VSTIKVDAIQKLNGSVPKASDLGLNVAGTVLQVLTATDSTERTTTSTSLVTASNTLAVTITPSSTSSKIFVTCSFSYGTPSGTYGFKAAILRGSTNLAGSVARFGNLFNGTSYNYSHATFSALDAPSTTSATTYQLYFLADANTARINNGGGQGSFSTITAFEIGG